MKEDKVTLEEIAARKAKVLHRIRAQHATMSKLSQEIFSPFFPSDTSAKSEVGIMKTFSSLMNVYDGFMIGLKIVSTIKTFLGFGRKRR